MNQIKTIAFRKKTAEAHIGSKELPSIKYLALGTGGKEENSLVSLTGNETQLKNEVFRIECNKVIENGTTVKCNYKIDSEDDPSLVGKKINEIGLFDETGTEDKNTGTLIYLQTRDDILVGETDTIDFVVYLEF